MCFHFHNTLLLFDSRHGQQSRSKNLEPRENDNEPPLLGAGWAALSMCVRRLKYMGIISTWPVGQIFFFWSSWGPAHGRDFVRTKSFIYYLTRCKKSDLIFRGLKRDIPEFLNGDPFNYVFCGLPLVELTFNLVWKPNLGRPSFLFIYNSPEMRVFALGLFSFPSESEWLERIKALAPRRRSLHQFIWLRTVWRYLLILRWKELTIN